jgi:cation:H+ antiporter
LPVTFTTSTAATVFPVAALVSLAASALLVSRLERIAGRVGLSEAMLGVVVAMAADSPEITAAVTATVHGQTGVGAGVVLGSNVFNLAALLGLGAMVARRIDLHRRVVVFEGIAAVWLASVTLIVITSDWGAAVGLALALLVVVPYLLITGSPAAGARVMGLPARAASWLRQAVAEEELELRDAIHPTAGGRLDRLTALGAIVVVVIASTFMERSADQLGRHFGWSSLVIGAVVLAAVTSIPNAVGAVFLARRGRATAVLSEAMNSNMINVVVGLFLAGVFAGFAASSSVGTSVAAWYFALTVVSLTMAFFSRGLDRREGAVIIGGYLAFLWFAILA